MSFSGQVKEELVRQVSESRHCRLAEIAAILSFGTRFTSCSPKSEITKVLLL